MALEAFLLNATSIIASLTLKDYLTLAAILLFTYCLHYYYVYFTRPNPLPGPFPLPILGNIHQMGTNAAAWANENFERYGDVWETYMGSNRNIWFARADLTEKLFSPSTKTNFRIRVDSPGLHEAGIADTGVAFNTHLTKWPRNRKFLAQTLLKPSFMEHGSKVTIEQFGELRDILMGMQKNGELLIDVSPWIHSFFCDVSVMVASGRRANAVHSYYDTEILKNPKKRTSALLSKPIDGNAISDDFHSVKDFELAPTEFMDATRIFLFGIGFFGFIPGFLRHTLFWPIQYKFIKNIQWLKNSLQTLVRERRAEIERIPMDQPLRPDVLTLLITTNTEQDLDFLRTGEDTEPLTDEDIAMIIFEVFGGGIDTTSSSICFVLYYLCKHPHVKQRLIEEIDTVFENGCREPTMALLDRLPYTDAVVNETSRLMPVVPGVFRVNSTDDWVAGHHWKAGQIFWVNTHALQLNPKHWKDPHSFNPDRFFGAESHRNIIKNSFAPFGAGIRMCPGRATALVQIRTFLALFFLAFDAELENPDAPLNKEYTVANHCKELRLRLTPRSTPRAK